MTVLDLFCGGGGASMGYFRAGFDVVGVDMSPQPDYPFDFVQADALRPPFDLSEFDLIHASPPCQAHTRAGHLARAQGNSASTIDLVGATRAMLADFPHVIENVEGAPLYGATKLCGSSFGLGVRRHRLFECSFWVLAHPCDHDRQGRPIGVYHRLGDSIPRGGKTADTLDQAQEAMGIDWLPWTALKEAIPPAYTEYIGTEFLQLMSAGSPAPTKGE